MFGEEVLGEDGVSHDGPAAEQLGPGGGVANGFGAELVHSASDAFLDALGHAGHFVVFVVEGHVVEDLFIVLIHAFQAILHEDGDFVAEGGVDAVGDGAGA